MIAPEELIALLSLRNASVRGSEITCSCPFPENHPRGDRRPSFGISVEKGAFNCFSCHESGTLTALVERLLGVSRAEAFRLIGYEVTPEEALRLMAGRACGPKAPVSPMACDVDRWSRNRHPYWAQRGFTEETVGKWRLGYDPRENRVVVPIYYGGGVVGWTKRAVDDVTRPKWTHSENTPASRILFGLDEAQSESEAILVEAPLSAIMLWQYGIRGAVASFGCNLSDDQAVLLRSRFDSVKIFYDPDEPGERGVAKALPKLADFMDVGVVRRTRDDPAAMTEEECRRALYDVPTVPSWAWDWYISAGRPPAI